MSKNHLIVIYILLAILTFFTFSQKTGKTTDLDDIKNRVIKVEFLQEATRIRDNLVGFKQVNASLANDAERIKSCNESKDLLIEWSEDVKKLGNNYSDRINNNQDAKEYFDAISKLNDAIAADCNKLTSN
ncbi:MAG: hypothetical protein Q7R77_00960 [Candidatus Daviesbacteria bacterium]|nr:hypothetical protein [Candidatus Daviesbacteria bacterium]